MEDNLKENIMDKFMNKDKKTDNEFGDFIKKVDEIQALVKGMSSKDETLAKESMEKADEILKNSGKKAKTKTTGDDSSSSEDETASGDNEATMNKKKTFNRTIINHKAFQDEKKKTQPTDQEGFMKAVEEDAKRRTEDRKKKKEEAAVWKEKGEKFFNDGKYKDALDAFDKALSAFKDWPALWTGRAMTHLQLGNPSQALDDCDWAFRSDEKSLNAHVTMSRIRRKQGQYACAVEVLRKALNFHPGKKSLINKYIVEATLEEANEKEKKSQK